MSRSGKRKRILMLLENSTFPGDPRVRNEAEALDAAGFDVTVICPTGASTSRKWAETLERIRVYRYPRPFEIDGLVGYILEYGYSITMLFLVSIFVFMRRGFDVVHVHTPPDMTGLIAIFYQFLGKRFVFDHHDLSPELYLACSGKDKPNVVYKLLRFFERVSCRHADRLIATNVSQQNIQTNRCGADPSRCYVVRNGPNESFLNDVQPKPELRDLGRFVLGYVGAIGIQDGVDFMVRAIHELRVKHNREDFIAVIVGGGPALASLKTLADELKVTDLIQFTGPIPFAEVPTHIAAFDICLTPDPSNAYNDSCTTVKTMEYMALRKPTVCFRTHENELTAGKSALYADNNDIAAFSRLIIRLMDDPSERKSMGEIARARIDHGLTWAHQAIELVALYQDLFGATSPSAVDGSLEKMIIEKDVVEHAIANGSGEVLDTNETIGQQTENSSEQLVHSNGSTVAQASDSGGSNFEQDPETNRSDLDPAKSNFQTGLTMRFAFNGAVGDVLRDHCLRDAKLAQLSAKFKLYYRLRPLIPVQTRQMMQRARNQRVDVPAGWYFPTTFIDKFQKALQSEPDSVAIHPWPDGFQMSAVLTHDVETKVGLALADKLAALEEKFGFRSAWNIVPYKYKIDQGLINDLKDRGHEIGIHGYNHDGRLFLSHQTFMRRTRPINQAIARFGSAGFRAPMVHRNLEWLQALDIDYDTSCFDVDPFQAMPGGVGGPWPFLAGNFVELPYTLPQDHTLLISLGETTPRIWIEKFAYLRSLSGMAMLLTHPDYLDTQSGLDVYRRFLEHVAEQSACWHALPRQVAHWWRQRDNLKVVGEADDAKVIGPMAQRARLFSLSELTVNEV